ncbi:subtilisin family serine protease [Mucilaginibacter yixingensis]|uniref:Subtilisin family serine protease n=1 Tax=Mucilaginibacter yixingensis TaxID=1295612 RepID=A0A2T5JF13_9SPHI|nr:S8 family serine peptidase [Mucilaginibacter yixingensis]PTR01030.1 subtilisin family serine protease [Mucilaginibacter yixingensis]
MKSYTFLLLFIISTLAVSCKKSETPQPPATISIDPDHLEISSVNPAYSYRVKVSIANSTETTVTWTSEDPRIASVGTDGLIKALVAGQTNIVATLGNGIASAKCKITITDEYDYKYRITLKDKGQSDFSIARPEAFLSAKAIERRRKRNIAIDETDLPISSDYIKAIKNVGGTIVAQSKWLGTVSVLTSDQLLVEKYKALPFVKDVTMVWQGKRLSSAPAAYTDAPQAGTHNTIVTPITYGAAATNITVNNGQALHNNGFTGKGIDIAVIDAGFINLKSNPYFNNITIKGAKSFVYENHDPYAIDDHGVWVTSCMAVNKPGSYVGTAPDANYWLLRTEDEADEYPIEEDYWVNAIEYADSVGVDIVNSSLTYNNDYYIPAAQYKFEDMDGKTATATRAANLAFAKGIFIVCCSGNERSWVGTPADSPNVLTIGGVTPTGLLASFTAWDVTVDGRVKPDIMSLSSGAAVINTSGSSEMRSGTSYASPIICGLAACLWQAYPQLTNKDLLDIFRKSGDKADSPAIPFGYGIPDMQKALTLAKTAAAGK